MGLNIFISVADASGDRHAAEIHHRAAKTSPPMRTSAASAEHEWPSRVRCCFHETVRRGRPWAGGGALRAFEVMRILRRVRKRFETERPDLHVCIDSSAMNLPFAKMAKSMGIPVLYYIAPQLWASPASRG